MNTKKQQVGAGWHDRDPGAPCKSRFPVDLKSKAALQPALPMPRSL